MSFQHYISVVYSHETQSAIYVRHKRRQERASFVQLSSPALMWPAYEKSIINTTF